MNLLPKLLLYGVVMCLSSLLTAYAADRTEGTVMQMPEYAQAVAAEAEAAQAPSDPGGLIASMIKVTELDKIMVKGRTAPPQILAYDAQLLRLFSRHPATLAEHQRDPAWNNNKHALFAEREALLQSYSNAVTQKNEREEQANRNMADVYGNGHPNQCVGPMGQDMCHPKFIFRGWCPGQPVDGYETSVECPPGVRGDGYKEYSR